MKKSLLCSFVMAALLPLGLQAQEAPAKKKAADMKVATTVQPLYFVKTESANVPLPAAALNTLDKEWIKSINVLRDQTAISQFGPKAKDGVVLIELKPEKEQAFLQIVNDKNLASAEGVNIQLDGQRGEVLADPLYVIITKDGEVAVKKEDISGVNPEWIKSINVFRGPEAEKRFNGQGEKGVILITFAPEKEQEVLRHIKNNK